MVATDPLIVTRPEIQKHPFQIESTPGPRGPHGVICMERGFLARLDMPGVERTGFKFFLKPNNVLTFNTRAPKKESFPYDESERVYAGFLRITGEPLVTPIRVRANNGSFFMFFRNQAALFLLPSPRSPPPQISSGSVKSDKGAGSSSGKSIVEHEGIIDQFSLDAMNLAASGKSGSPRSSSVKSRKGSAKNKKRKGSSSGKSNDKAKASTKDVSHESSSNKSDEGSRSPGLSKSSTNEVDEAWMLAYIKRNILQVDIPEPPKEESVPVETSASAKSSHEMPEIAIGSVEEMGNHGSHCQCQCCDSDGICLKTWSTTEDIIGYINGLKIQGPEGACEKRVVQEEGLYSVYVRADLPGLDPSLCVTTVRNSCILVCGNLPPQELKNRVLGARSYLFFVQLRCSCCKFDDLVQDHENGVLRLFSKIRGPEPGPSGD